MSERSVNSRQLEVLKWVVNGCPDDVMPGTSHKVTAVALQNRRLVKVSKKGGIWKAKATEAGRHFAEHGSYPEGHWQAPIQPASEPVRRPAVSKPAPKSPVERKVTGLRPVEQMIADIVAASGELEIKDGEGYYNNLVSSAIRHNKVPDGKLLQVIHGRRWGEKTLRLVDQPTWVTAADVPIPVPERLDGPHPAVHSLSADTRRLRFKREPRNRALRILDAIAKAADARGYTVAAPEWEQYQRNRPGDLLITIMGHPHRLHVKEQTDKIPHMPTPKELRDVEQRGYPPIPKYDHVPAGRLTISIDGGVPVRQSSFGDTKTIDLADRLATFLQELELRAADAEERRLIREREAAEKRRGWEQAVANAKTALRQDHRAKTLLKQAGQWRQSQELTSYVDAMKARVAELAGEERKAADAWLVWAHSYLTMSNPLNHQLRLPDDPEYTPDALKPFMGGWSPYGPDRTYGW